MQLSRHPLRICIGSCDILIVGRLWQRPAKQSIRHHPRSPSARAALGGSLRRWGYSELGASARGRKR